MKYKILIPNTENNNFYFTKDELEKLLDETYEEGYKEGSKKYVYCYPTTHTEPYNTITQPYITYSTRYVDCNTVTTANSSEYATPTINTKGE